MKYKNITDNTVIVNALQTHSNTIKDVMTLFIIIIIGSISLYYFNISYARTFYYISVMSLFYLAERDEYWIVLLYFMSTEIFMMFSLRPYVWIFPVTSSVGIDWYSIMPLVMLIKYHKRTKDHKRVKNLLKNKYKLFIGYTIYLLIWGTLVYRHNAASFIYTWNSITVMLMFAYLPSVFTYNKMLYISRIIFIFSVILVILVVVELVVGNVITHYFTFGVRRVLVVDIEGEQLTRRTLGIFISYYSLIMSLFYLANRRKDFSNLYLLFIAAVSWFNILNVATRGWMLSTIFLMFSFMIIYARKVLTMLFVPKILLAIMLFIGLIYLFAPQQVTNNFNLALSRLKTVESVFTEGDMTAGGTASRWDTRGPRVLRRFSESPIFGFGFSQVTQQYYDGHVGNHSLLLEGGILGLIIVYLTVITLIFYFLRSEFIGERGSGVFGLALISIMIIHSTSRSMISFRMSHNTVFLLCLLFAHYNAYAHQLRNSIAYKHKLRS